MVKPVICLCRVLPSLWTKVGTTRATPVHKPETGRSTLWIGSRAAAGAGGTVPP
jgi:hypothetical protein